MRVVAALQCFGKVSYATATGAWTAIRRLERRHALEREKGRRITAYRCPRCHQFHIGHEYPS